MPGSTPPQALQDAPTTPWAGLPVPPGRWARLSIPAGPAGHSDHPLGRTPHPPRLVCPNLRPHRPCRTLRPPPGQDSPSPEAGVPGSTPPQALQDAPTTPWAGLPVPPGRCARFYLPTSPAGHSDHPLGRTPHPPSPRARLSIPAGPAGNSDHPLGWTPHPPRPVCPVLRPHRPSRTLRPPPGHNSPSPKAGVTESTSPQAQRCTPTTPWAGLPIPPGRWARLFIPAGLAGNSDHPLGRTPHPPRLVCPVLRPQRPCRTLRPSPRPGCPSPQALQETPTTAWAGLPIPQGRCARFYVPAGPAGHSDHPLGWTPHPPRPVCPVLRPHRPCRKLRPPTGLDSPPPQAGVPGSTPQQALQDAPTTPWAGLPVPPGRCARLSIPAVPAGRSDHPLGGTPHPPRPVCPVLRPHRPCRTLRPPLGQDSPSPQAGGPSCPSPQALQETATTPWAGLPIPSGPCARFYVPTSPAGHSDHPLGRTPRPPGAVCPNLPPHRPSRTLRPTPGQDYPSPQAGAPGCPSPQFLQETPTTPWAGLPIPLGRCAWFLVPTGPAGRSDHPLGRTPHPPRPVRPVVYPCSPCRKLRPPLGLDSPSPQAGVPGSSSPRALQDAPTTPWAELPVPPGRCARIYLPTGPAMHSDHPLGRTPRPPRLVCPNLHPHRPCRTLRPPPGQDSPSPQAGVPDSTSPQALRDTPATPWAGLPVPQAGVPGSSSPRALQDTPTTDRCPLPPGSEAVHCKSSTARCPEAVRQCIAGVALPTAPGQ